MMFTIDNNPISRLECFLHNKKEELSRVHWLMGKRKEVECRICGDKLDSRKDVYSPMQCGWKKINKYIWVCHRCLDHRNFRPFIEMIDETERKGFEEHNRLLIQIDLKAKEVISLLKEYLPKYKETLDLYYLWNLDYNNEDEYAETNFIINIKEENEKYELQITNKNILEIITEYDKKSKTYSKRLSEIAYYVDEEKLKTNENHWTWDDAIEVIKKRLEEKHYENGTNRS